jgi:ribosomal protein S18 acetylase RimI-like enzyme
MLRLMPGPNPVPVIRRMTPADVAAATGALLADHFGDRRAWLEFATSHPGCRTFVAEAGDGIVGTAVGTANGNGGWLATIWVAPVHRGHGLGRELTQRTMDELAAAGCRSFVLVSTDAGRRLYERMGFEVQSSYRILEAAGSDAAPGSRPAPELSIRPFDPADLPALLRLDAEATGEDRRHVLEPFATPSSTKVAPDQTGALDGFVVRAPWGGGATIARSTATGLRILQARRAAAGRAGRVRVGLLSDNEAGLAALEREGLRPIWSAPRMVFGEALAWHPDWIWGQLNHAIG